MTKTIIKTQFQYDMEGLGDELINQFNQIGIKEINGPCETHNTNLNIILNNNDIINVQFKQHSYFKCETTITINNKILYNQPNNDFFINFTTNLYNLYKNYQVS